MGGTVKDNNMGGQGKKRKQQQQQQQQQLQKQRKDQAAQKRQTLASESAACGCPHLKKAVQFNNIRGAIKSSSSILCKDCSQLPNSPKNEEAEVCICLHCGRMSCTRSTTHQHAIKHQQQFKTHALVVNAATFQVWCYECDKAVVPEQGSNLFACMIHIKRCLSGDATVDDEPVAHVAKKAVMHAKAMPGMPVRGLLNLGNTCFFNCIVQSLNQASMLHGCLEKVLGVGAEVTVKAPEQAPLVVTLDVPQGTLTKAMCSLFAELRFQSQGTVSPRAVFNQISKVAPRFSGFQQQDSQELLRFLLDSLRTEEAKRVKTAVLRSMKLKNVAATNISNEQHATVRAYGKAIDHSTFVDSVFGGRLISSVTCLACQTVSSTFEHFLDLSLPVQTETPVRGNAYAAGPTKAVPNVPRQKQTKQTSVERKQVQVEKKAEKKFAPIEQLTTMLEPRHLNKHQAKKEARKQKKEAKRKTKQKAGGKGAGSGDVSASASREDCAIEGDVGKEHEDDKTSSAPGEGEEVPASWEDMDDEEEKNAKFHADPDSEAGQSREHDPASMPSETANDAESVQARDTGASPGGDKENVDVNGRSMTPSQRLTGEEAVADETGVATDSASVDARAETSCSGDVVSDESTPIAMTDLSSVNGTGEPVSFAAQVSNISECSVDLHLFDSSSSEGGSTADLTSLASTQQPGETLSVETTAASVRSAENVGGEDSPVPDMESEPANGAAQLTNGVTTTQEMIQPVTGDSTQDEGADTEACNGSQDQATETAAAASLGPVAPMAPAPTCGSSAVATASPARQVSPSAAVSQALDLSGFGSVTAMGNGADAQQRSLESCLMRFARAEVLDGSNKFGCETCTRRRREKLMKNGEINGESDEVSTVYSLATKQILVQSLPPVLTLHLKRFRHTNYRGGAQKINSHVPFPVLLDMGPFCSTSAEVDRDTAGRVLYSLFAVAEHSGSMKGGHYTAYIKSRLPLGTTPEAEKRVEKEAAESGGANMSDTATGDQAKNAGTKKEVSGDSDGADSAPGLGGSGKVSSNTSADGKASGVMPFIETPPDSPNSSAAAAADKMEPTTPTAPEAAASQCGTSANPPPGSWFYASDSQISSASEQQVLKCQAYILFYERLPVL